MNRRGFLKGILAAGIAPYVVTSSGVLMPVRSLARSFPGGLLTLYGDGVTDDTAAMQAYMDGKKVVFRDGSAFTGSMRGGIYLVSSSIKLASNISLSDGMILGASGLHGPAFIVDSTENVSFSGIHIKGNPPLEVL